MFYEFTKNIRVRTEAIDSVRIDPVDYKRGKYTYQVIIDMRNGQSFYTDTFDTKDEALARVDTILAIIKGKEQS